MLKIKHSKKSEKFLKKCDKIIAKRIIDKIENLAENPFPQDCKRVQGKYEKTFRVRVGDYRILYLVYNEKNFLFVSDIDKRPRVYD
jgi:mRNA interferase RelE/StbE